MSQSLPQRVQVVEVAPRDGLQNESVVVNTDQKVDFINRLSAAGCSHIEVTSFVSPKWVPTLADHAEVFRRIEKAPNTVYSALVPNRLGMERALDAGVRHVAIFSAASDTFTRKNINASVEESFERFREVCGIADREDIPVRGYISTTFGCPYEGDVPVERVVEVARAFLDLGVDEISLGDTIGVATSSSVEAVLQALSAHVPSEKIAVHFHDTHGRALTNVMTALQAGIVRVDASAGGLGGCPYAAGASGNLATEDLLSWLASKGIETGIDLEQVAGASLFMERQLGRELPSRHLQARRSRSS
jgi:isopropylmalate/homocitrate/citramalate synthase